MKLIVWNKGIWKQSKFTNGENKRVSFKSLDKEDKKTYYLNIDTTHNVLHIWEPFIIEGNILDIALMSDGKTINKFIAPKLIKGVK